MRNAVLAALTVLYPLVVYLGLGHFEPRWLAFLLLGLALARLTTSRERVWWAAAVLAAVLALATFLANAALPLKLYPVIVSGLLLALFAASLAHPPTAVERLARLTNPDLPPKGVAYTRKVTWVWCGFFVLNGTLAAATALWGSDAAWALYNGLIAYGLMGLLFGGEWLVRRRVMAGSAHV
ncbi:hypothetical protein [Piscinibacter sp.]|uniref:COG4648 family protein n=1 Tax=Piscinibacter sp. TaxID=1903157 RepID=UPI00355A8CCC